MAESYPKSTFTGVDFAPIFPQEKKPENAKFLQANILDGLPFLDDTFDFVHMRLLVTAFSSREWEEKVIPELARITRQGGWVEFMESDIQYYNEGPTTQRLTEACKYFLSYFVGLYYLILFCLALPCMSLISHTTKPIFFFQ